MKPFITFIRKNGYGERTYHLKNHGYFKLPAHFALKLDKCILRDLLLGTSQAFKNPDDFIALFEVMLYRHWQVEELRTCRGELPSPQITHDVRDKLFVSFSPAKLHNGIRLRSFIKRTRRGNESLADFAERMYAWVLEVQDIWRKRFIRTPMEFLTFSETLEPENESEDVFDVLRKEDLESNHQFRRVGKTKYQRNIIRISGENYFIVPKYMTLTAKGANQVNIYITNADGSSSCNAFDAIDPAAMRFHLKNALQKILNQRGVLEYHSSKDSMTGIQPEKTGFYYSQPAAISYRDGTGRRIFSHSQRELLIRQAADKRWIANNLEIKSLDGLTILHKEFPKDPM